MSFLHGALMSHVDPFMTHVNDFHAPIGEMMVAACGADQAKSWAVQQQHVHRVADAIVGRNRQTVPSKVD